MTNRWLPCTFGISFSVQNFKREEQNFVVQNEINNLSFLTGDNKTKMSKVDLTLCSHQYRVQLVGTSLYLDWIKDPSGSLSLAVE